MRPREVRLGCAVQRAIDGAARAAWPGEFAAALGGQCDDGIARIDRLRPFPGAGAADTFAVPPAVFAAAEAELRAAGATWLGFVHSHPGGSAAPSLADRETLWRDCVQLVVGGAAPDRLQTAAFWLDGDTCAPLPISVPATEAAP